MEAPWLTPPKKFKRVYSAGKVVASIFWDIQGVTIIDYLEQGHTINGAYYAGEFRRLRQKRRVKTDSRCSAFAGQRPCPHVTSCHDCMWIWNPSPSPYSPDTALPNFYLFPKLKTHLRRTQYGSNEGAIEAVNKFFGDQEKAFYFGEIRKLEQRWAKCIVLKRDYIEK